MEVYDAEAVAEAPCLFRLESRSSSKAFTWLLRDLVGNNERPGPTLPSQRLVYWGADRFVLRSTSGGDHGLVTATRLTIVSATSPYAEVAVISTPGPVLSSRRRRAHADQRRLQRLPGARRGCRAGLHHGARAT